MDFVHNPYRCGPLRVGRYELMVDNPASRKHSFRWYVNLSLVSGVVVTSTKIGPCVCPLIRRYWRSAKTGQYVVFGCCRNRKVGVSVRLCLYEVKVI